MPFSQARLIKQRGDEKNDRQNPEQTLRDRRERISDEDTSGGSRRSLPVVRGEWDFFVFLGRAALLPSEVFPGEHATDGSEDESEKGADAEEKEADDRSGESADGSAYHAPVARPEAFRAV